MGDLSKTYRYRKKWLIAHPYSPHPQHNHRLSQTNKLLCCPSSGISYKVRIFHAEGLLLVFSRLWAGIGTTNGRKVLVGRRKRKDEIRNGEKILQCGFPFSGSCFWTHEMDMLRMTVAQASRAVNGMFRKRFSRRQYWCPSLVGLYLWRMFVKGKETL